MGAPLSGSDGLAIGCRGSSVCENLLSLVVRTVLSLPVRKTPKRQTLRPEMRDNILAEDVRGE